MSDAPKAANLMEYLAGRLRRLPAASRLVVVLDPAGKLGIEARVELGLRVWQCLRYDGNDLAFRQHYRPEREWPLLVHVASSPWRAADELDLSSLVDVVRQADDIIDLSLTGVLSDLVPGETWPPDSVDKFADIFAERLDAVADAHAALRTYLHRSEALDVHTVRALALCCVQPGVPPKTFLFRRDSASRLLADYIQLAFSVEWDARGRELLQQQAREASRVPLGLLAPWFEVVPEAIAIFTYWYRFLQRAGVPNLANQLRGLGFLDFDPEALEPGVDIALQLWERDPAWRARIVRQAETDLDTDDARRAVGLLKLTTPNEIARAIEQAEAPAIIAELGGRLLRAGQETKQMIRAVQEWSEHRPAALDGMTEADSAYARRSLALATILDESSRIIACLSRDSAPPPELGAILDWYVMGGLYNMEFAHARALAALQRITDEPLRELAQTFLRQLRRRLRDFLDQADHALAQRVSGNWSGFLTSDRLSTRVLWDFVKSARLKPSTDSCLWFIVFDGMRYDTWQQIVKPRLMKTFSVKKEKAFFSILPSWTRIARTSLIGGQDPQNWRGTRRSFTFDQGALAAALFGLTEAEQDRKLRFYSGMESDLKTQDFDRRERFPYNVLVFNLSDDNLHKQRGHIGMLNDEVEVALNSSLEFLDGLIQPQDTVIVSSDHGFVELDPDDAVVVRDDERWSRLGISEEPVRYRYIIGVERPGNLTPEQAFSFEHRAIADGKGKFTVAIGKTWFQRPGVRQGDRYAHGGLSFAEMVVPGAVMQLITEKKMELVFETLPPRIEVSEDDPVRATISVLNKGNQPADFEFTASADTDSTPQILRRSLAPGERLEVPVTIVPIVQKNRVTQSLRLALKYSSIGGRPKTTKKEIPILVSRRTDKVEISFGGLDDLE